MMMSSTNNNTCEEEGAESAIPAKLRQRHKMEEKFLQTRIKQVKRNKKLSPASMEQQIKDMTEELRQKHAKEIQEVKEQQEEEEEEEQQQEEEKGEEEDGLAGIPLEVIYPPTSDPADDGHATGGGTCNGEGAGNHGDGGRTKTDDAVQGRGKKKTRAQKRREKKEQEREELRRLAQNMDKGPDMRLCELATLRVALEELDLQVSPVAADGNCLFRAVADQLQQLELTDKLSILRTKAQGSPLRQASSSGASLETPHCVLRVASADYISRNQETFEPFLLLGSAETGDGLDFHDYCMQIADTSGKKWGGQPEIVALSHILVCPIEVWRASEQTINNVASKCTEDQEFDEILQRARGSSVSARDVSKDCFGEDEGGPLLRISFHTHYYATGDHYNSIRPKVQ
eukprot:gb/GECG01006621.1/.p1 GENE.gb/GECG01006621.1/~~gb/GECG01006621.1/.p1  ORF type:complete len:401 (+),score=86.99 gb/GECG01006621.1/:1-1203(+)